MRSVSEYVEAKAEEIASEKREKARVLCTPEALHTVLRKTKQRISIESLADKFDVPPKLIRENLSKLSDRNIMLHVAPDATLALTQDIPQSPPTILNTKSQHWTVIGAVADNHLCSRYARLDILESLFDVFQSEGITTVYQGGNMIDGEARFNVHDLLVHGFENQLDYFVEHWPQRKGITTHFVTGDDHEGWYVQREGIDVGKRLEQAAIAANRHDLHYLGHMEADIHLQVPGSAEPRIMRVIHAGGGTGYAISYSMQTIINSYTGGEKPHVLLAGHYHKADYVYWREVHGVQLASTMMQSPWMRKKKLQSVIGGWIIRILQDDDGTILRFAPEFLPYYDLDFYKKRWHFITGSKDSWPVTHAPKKRKPK